MQRRLLLASPTLLLAQAATSPDITQEMVGVSHRDPKRVREILDLQPGLANASIDWGFGDWESALDAASHVGNREVAELLLSRGARPTIFSAAMLGQLDVVKNFIALQPGIQKTYGPHGITLFAHARSNEMKEYLKSLGDADNKLPSLPVSAEEKTSLSGKYAAASGAFEINVQNDRLGLSGPGVRSRVLIHHKGALEFYPSGAPWVKITFPKAGTLSIQGGAFNIQAQRA
jgi:hypothetical protein